MIGLPLRTKLQIKRVDNVTKNHQKSPKSIVKDHTARQHNN